MNKLLIKRTNTNRVAFLCDFRRFSNAHLFESCLEIQSHTHKTKNNNSHFPYSIMDNKGSNF